MTPDEHNQADLRWCARAAKSAVEELLVAGFLSSERADWAVEIIAQDLHIQLISGIRPPDAISERHPAFR